MEISVQDSNLLRITNKAVPNSSVFLILPSPNARIYLKKLPAIKIKLILDSFFTKMIFISHRICFEQLFGLVHLNIVSNYLIFDIR